MLLRMLMMLMIDDVWQWIAVINDSDDVNHHGVDEEQTMYVKKVYA